MRIGGRRIAADSLWTGAAWVVAVSLAGGWTTELGSWYRALERPAWQPPDWLFAPVWTTIFALSAAALVVAWNLRDRAPGGSGRGRLLAAYGVNGVLNVAWGALFFRFQRPDWALAETVLLALSVGWMMLEVGRRYRPAAWLLAPYLAWVSFAFVLNYAIVRMNGPFGGG